MIYLEYITLPLAVNSSKGSVDRTRNAPHILYELGITQHHRLLIQFKEIFTYSAAHKSRTRVHFTNLQPWVNFSIPETKEIIIDSNLTPESINWSVLYLQEGIEWFSTADFCLRVRKWGGGMGHGGRDYCDTRCCRCIWKSPGTQYRGQIYLREVKHISTGNWKWKAD